MFGRRIWAGCVVGAAVGVGCATGAEPDLVAPVAPLGDDASATASEGGTGPNGDGPAPRDGGATRQEASAPSTGTELDGSGAQNPVPVLTSLTPATAAVGGATPLTLTLAGNGFVPASHVRFAGSVLATTFVSAAELTATVQPSNLVGGGSVPVTVRNPAPGGGESNPVPFELTTSAPVVTAIAPSSAVAGSGSLEIVVTGTSFASNALVALDNATQSTLRVDATQLRTTIDAARLRTGGVLQVTVVHSPVAASNAVAFTVVNAAPTLASITPSTVAPGSPDTSIALTGSGFSGSTVVSVQGLDVATTYISGTQVTAMVPAAQLTTVGTRAVAVRNPAPGGGAAATTVDLVVIAPPPTVTSLTPQGIIAGSPQTAVVVRGTGFVAASAVRVDGAPVPTRYVGVTQLEADIPATMLVAPGARNLTVTSPPPGGGTSGAAVFTVYGATCTNTTGVDTPLGTPGTVITKTLDFSTAAPTARRLASTGACPATLGGRQAARAYVVQNTLSTEVVLQAWAVCAATDDAYLTFYRRATVPQSDAELMACTGQISEGAAGGGLTSPEAGNSSWCPGLTKANGGGLPLAPCEKAVVYITPYDASSATFTSPGTLKMSTELP